MRHWSGFPGLGRMIELRYAAVCRPGAIRPTKLPCNLLSGMQKVCKEKTHAKVCRLYLT